MAGFSNYCCYLRDKKSDINTSEIVYRKYGIFYLTGMGKSRQGAALFLNLSLSALVWVMPTEAMSLLLLCRDAVVGGVPAVFSFVMSVYFFDGLAELLSCRQTGVIIINC